MFRNKLAVLIFFAGTGIVSCQNLTEIPINSTIFTLDQVRKLKQHANLNRIVARNCTTFYNVEEISVHLNVCTSLAEDPAFIRSFSSAIAYLSPFNSSKEKRSIRFEEDEDSKPLDDEDFVSAKFARKVRQTNEKQFLPVGIRIRVHNPFRIMESKAIVEQPCIGKCMLMKTILFDDDGRPNRTAIISQVLDVISMVPNPEERATDIADVCLRRYRNRMRKISRSDFNTHEDRVSDECRVAARLGICLPRDAFKVCKEELIGSATSRKPGKAHA